MPNKKRKSSKRVSVTIIGAIIAAFGVVTAAIIGILPKIIGENSDINSIATVSPEVFNKYEDPSGFFTMKYPYDYSVFSRNLTNQDLRLALSNCNCFNISGSSSPPNHPGGIIVSTGIDKNGILNQDTNYENMVESIINSNNYFFQSLESDDNIESVKTILISSEQRDNGYIIHAQTQLSGNFKKEEPYDVYIYSQYRQVAFDNNDIVYFRLAFFIGHHSVDAELSSIEYTIESLNISFTKIIEAFTQ